MKTKRKTHVGLPIPLSALLPTQILNGLRKSFQGKDAAQIQQELKMLAREDAEGREDANAEVFVHLSSHALSAFGHVDICILDTVYSYGCYDTSSHRLFGAISDGVIAKVPREAYVRFALQVEEKILIGYKLSLTTALLERMQQKAKEMLPELEAWDCPYAQWEKAGAKGEAPTDESSQLYHDAGARYFKVKKRKYRWFFVFNTNCVRFADELLGAIGMDQTHLSGTLTPGEYAVVLENQLGEKGTHHNLVTAHTLYVDMPTQA